MPYTKQTWAAGAQGGTPLSPPRLDYIETGISQLATGADANLLTVGEETLGRELATSGAVAVATDQLRLGFFTCRKSQTTTQVRVIGGTTAAAATPTLIRIGLYSIDGSGNGTLAASTVNDTALFSVVNTTHTKAWSSPYVMTFGARYALGVLVVTTVATPTLLGSTIGAAGDAEVAMSPRLTGRLTGQTDLPGTFTGASLTSTVTRYYGVILP